MKKTRRLLRRGRATGSELVRVVFVVVVFSLDVLVSWAFALVDVPFCVLSHHCILTH
jgi:hypothetical protein